MFGGKSRYEIGCWSLQYLHDRLVTYVLMLPWYDLSMGPCRIYFFASERSSDSGARFGSAHSGRDLTRFRGGGCLARAAIITGNTGSQSTALVPRPDHSTPPATRARTTIFVYMRGVLGYSGVRSTGSVVSSYSICRLNRGQPWSAAPLGREIHGYTRDLRITDSTLTV